jgi:hypothetical protein
MLQIFNRVVLQDFDKEDPVKKKLMLAVVATAVAGLIALLGAPLFAQSGAASQSTIQGVWRVTEVTTTGPNASKNSSPQPSQYIFTAKHFSFIRINATKPRPDLTRDTEPTATAAQLLAVYGFDALSAQSGTYEVAGGKLTTRAVVARGNGPMASGAFSTATYKLDGNTLTITQERNTAGPVANPTTWKLTRIE